MHGTSSSGEGSGVLDGAGGGDVKVVSRKTSTTWRRSVAASAALGASLSSSSASDSYCRFSRTSKGNQHRHEDDDPCAPRSNLVMAMMMSTTNDRTCAGAVDEQAGPPTSFFVGEVVLAMPACDSVKLVNTPIA